MTQKNLSIENVKQAKDKIPDLKVFGDGDTWVLLCKASSVDPNSNTVWASPPTHAVAEAITFVPKVRIIKLTDHSGLPTLVNISGA